MHSNFRVILITVASIAAISVAQGQSDGFVQMSDDGAYNAITESSMMETTLQQMENAISKDEDADGESKEDSSGTEKYVTEGSEREATTDNSPMMSRDADGSIIGELGNDQNEEDDDYGYADIGAERRKNNVEVEGDKSENTEENEENSADVQSNDEKNSISKTEGENISENDSDNNSVKKDASEDPQDNAKVGDSSSEESKAPEKVDEGTLETTTPDSNKMKNKYEETSLDSEEKTTIKSEEEDVTSATPEETLTTADFVRKILTTSTPKPETETSVLPMSTTTLESTTTEATVMESEEVPVKDPGTKLAPSNSRPLVLIVRPPTRPKINLTPQIPLHHYFNPGQVGTKGIFGLPSLFPIVIKNPFSQTVEKNKEEIDNSVPKQKCNETGEEISMPNLSMVPQQYVPAQNGMARYPFQVLQTPFRQHEPISRIHGLLGNVAQQKPIVIQLNRYGGVAIVSGPQILTPKISSSGHFSGSLLSNRFKTKPQQNKFYIKPQLNNIGMRYFNPTINTHSLLPYPYSMFH